MKRYNTPHRHRVIKTRLTEEEYAEFSERVTLCQMSQSEYIRQALIKSRIRPVITVSPVNDELLSAVGKLTAEYGKIGGNLNQIARCLNEYGAPYNTLSNGRGYAPACRHSGKQAAIHDGQRIFRNCLYSHRRRISLNETGGAVADCRHRTPVFYRSSKIIFFPCFCAYRSVVYAPPKSRQTITIK